MGVVWNRRDSLLHSGKPTVVRLWFHLKKVEPFFVDKMGFETYNVNNSFGKGERCTLIGTITTC